MNWINHPIEIIPSVPPFHALPLSLPTESVAAIGRPSKLFDPHASRYAENETQKAAEGDASTAWVIERL